MRSPSEIATGCETKTVSGDTPSASAVASTNGLKEEPGCRSPWTARLNWLSRKFRPPTIARTRPSRGSIATSAAVGWDAGQEGGFGQRQLVSAVPEVDERSLLNPVRAVPEVDRVQVRGQDPVLRPTLLELPRQRRLVDLPCERALMRTARVLDELLGDRRAALNALTARDVRPDGTGDPAQVETSVFVEALVLHRDD